MRSIVVAELSKAFGKKQVLDGISFEVDEGSCVGIIGPNGAGKTTLIKIIAGLVHPTSGRVRVLDGSPFDNSVKFRVGYMPERPEFFEDKTVRYHIEFLAKLRGLEIDIEEILAKFNLSATKKARELSKGKRKKLSLALATLHNPDLLILDEPTAGLDPHATLALYDLIREAVEGGKTVLMSTHNLYEVDELCDQVVCINNGRIFFSGPIHELLDQPVLKIKTKDNLAALKLLKGEGIDAWIEGNWVVLDANPTRIFETLPENSILKVEFGRNIHDIFKRLRGNGG